MNSNSSHMYPPAPNYEEEPPAYGYGGSYLSENESPRHAAPTMRLLPTSTTTVDDDFRENVGNTSAYHYGEAYEEDEDSRTDHPRQFSNRYYQYATEDAPSRPASSMRNAPNIPPPATSVVDVPEYASRPGSPNRPWSPNRVGEWARAPRPPSVLSSQYERADLNGSPRPGTPSSRYGGSPRRPLPPAPLFTAPRSMMGEQDTSIDIGDPDDDVFGGGGRTIHRHGQHGSVHSFMSESTVITDEKEAMNKIDLDEDDEATGMVDPNLHYGPAPEKQSRRGVREAQMTKKEVQLVNGELILECKIPTILHSFLPRRDDREFTHMRYTAVTCDPDDFTQRGYKLRQQIGTTMRETELFICEGIAKNIVNQKQVNAHVYEYTTQVSLDSDLKFKGAEKGIMPCQVIFCLKEHNKKKLNSHRWFFNAFGRALQPNICILLDVGTKPSSTALYHLWKAFDQDSNVAGAAGEIKAGKGKGMLGLLNPLIASQNFEYKMSNILDKPLESVFGYITVLPGALSAYRFFALQNDAEGNGPLNQYFKGETLHGKDADVFTANMYLAEDRILCWELVAKREERWVLRFVKSAVGETDVPDNIPEFISQRRRWLNGAFFAAVYSIVNGKQLWKTDHSLPRKILLQIEAVYQFVQLLFTYFGLANFYLAFFFIAGSLSDPKIDPFGHSMGKWIFIILRYACVLVMCLQFIISMGNRPQGAKKLYLSGMIVYGIIMVYTIFCTLYLVVLELIAKTGGDSELAVSDGLFINIVVSLLSSVGLYFFSSFLYLDPWHMFTSSAQYFALLPSYICTLQVYAFCNTHDVTWGTKGDNVINTDLGAARIINGSIVEVEMPSEQLDIDSGYDAALRNLRDREEVPEPPVSESQLQEDYYRAVRTYMVSIWMVANVILAMAVSEVYGVDSGGTNIYLAIILWSVTGLALIRVIGSTTYAILHVVQKLVEGKAKFDAGNLAHGTGSATSSAVNGSTVQYGGGGTFRDKFTEAKWGMKQQVGKVMFWRK
ncbi:hypothetical protein AFLA_012947 [Aspergillus flavus NRRL3357]|nr:hypothetical protein AFLA_012947 [Aspergillus flavus NRRL3357]